MHEGGLEIVLIILVGCSGLLFLAIGGKALFLYYSERLWESVKCEIERSSIGYVDEVVGYGTVRYYFPEVGYSYQYSGKHYRSKKVAHDIKSFWFESKVDAAEILDRINFETVAYVSGISPGSSVLLKGLSTKRLQHHCVMAFSGLFLVIVAIFFYVSA